MSIVFTIGHSTHQTEKFIALLLKYSVDAVADVRSHPYSKYNPQFNQDILKKDLANNGVDYVFLGAELGARSEDPCCYVDNKVSYEKLAATALFQQGLDRIVKGLQTHTLALMCAEKDPVGCHRTILVARHLAGLELDVQHILADGSLESHDEAMNRLVAILKISPTSDMFDPTSPTDRGYQLQERKIAYQLPTVVDHEGIV